MNNQYDTIIDAISDLNGKGYSSSFLFKNESLYCVETKETFQPKNLKIKGSHRFEGATDLDDMSVLYMIEADSGSKGIIIDAYGTYSDSTLGEFLKMVDFSE